MAPADECIPYYTPDRTFTAKAKGAIKGKRFVKIEGNRTGGGGGGGEGVTTVAIGLSTDVENLVQVAQCGAKGQAVGIAGWTAADKAELLVYAKGKGQRVPVKAGEALTAGWEVESNAEGEAIKLAEGKALGYVMTAAESGKDAEILFY